MSKISSEEIRRIATLANIGLTDDQIDHFALELGQIVGFVERLSSVATDTTEPTNQVTGLVDVWREDEVRPGLTSEELQLNAPDWEDGHFKVKRVL
jgi:aspartyl-tRNA(Asn)/glutamyl-tRNA(Gln) amidotransferase subunit C